MRWGELFDDLEGQARSLDKAERDLEVADRTRAEVGRLSLINRLRSNVGHQVTLGLIGTGSLSGSLERLGVDWLLLACPHEVVVPMAAIATVANLPWDSTSPSAVGAVAGRLSLSSALRAIAVDRARVTVVLQDGTTVAGTPDRVGSDFVDIAVHHGDVAPRTSAVSTRTTLAYGAISKVVRDAGGWV